MKTELAPFGFRVVGDATETRRLVDAAAAFSAHCEDDPRAETHRECYLSAFQFGDDFKAHLEKHDTTKGFDGRCWARWLWFDIDRPNLDDGLQDVRRLAAFIVERYGLDGDELLAFFSGSKGFHLGLPLSLCGPLLPSGDFNRVCRRLAEGLAAKAAVTIDAGVFDKVRLFRAPNSTHPKTGLRKRRLTFSELLGLKVDRIVEFAREPLAFDVPDDPEANEQARVDWLEAADDFQRRQAATLERRSRSNATGSGRLNRSTLDFIRDGALSGDRHRALFAAAANLAEFGCPAALAYELLTEAALDCGLSPSEVRRQIDCGLAHGAKTSSGESTEPGIESKAVSNADDASATVVTSEASPELQAALQALWNGSRKAVLS